jgi:hypothetical protein
MAEIFDLEVGPNRRSWYSYIEATPLFQKNGRNSVITKNMTMG